jgi:hypothetical protein
MILYSIKFTERSHMRERSRLFGRYIRQNILQKMRYLIDDFLSPIFLKQLLVATDMFCGFIEGIEGQEQLLVLTIAGKNEQVNNDKESAIVNDHRQLSRQANNDCKHQVENGINIKPIKDYNNVDDRLLEAERSLVKTTKPELLAFDVSAVELINNEVAEPKSNPMATTDLTSLSNASNVSNVSSNINIADDIISTREPLKSANDSDLKDNDAPIETNNIPINIKSDDQEFIKQSLILNSIKKKIASTVPKYNTIDLSDDDLDDSPNEFPIDDKTNRFIETSEPINKTNRRGKTKTSIEKNGNKLRISVIKKDC